MATTETTETLPEHLAPDLMEKDVRSMTDAECDTLLKYCAHCHRLLPERGSAKAHERTYVRGLGRFFHLRCWVHGVRGATLD